MEQKHISKRIADYKDGNIDALEQLWKQMLPLIKKYAGKTHFMEYDDAYQEYSIALIEAINKIQIYDTDGQCLKYIAVCIKNKFCFLYKQHCAGVANEILDDIVIDDESITDAYDDVIFFADIENFVENLPSETKRNIASLSILQQKSDAEIALQLGLSRQYVNRVKKNFISNYPLYINKISNHNRLRRTIPCRNLKEKSIKMMYGGTKKQKIFTYG